ncbi:MAG: ACP S-malonyltransferase, partial [Bacteroidia bacterium]|nr:ACP S-malonyltransferase [Bacteroidia bacterium]
ILGFDIGQIMFYGTEEELKQTSVTQPAIYLHSVILAEQMNCRADAKMVAGHSLGEFSALAVAGVFSFEDGLRLVAARANAMQDACNQQASTMAAIVGLADEVVESLCTEIDDVVVPANYNSPGQLVISGTESGIEQAIGLAKSKGAKLAVKLQVNGAFHSPLMEPARAALEQAILNTTFQRPVCPVYQNYTAQGEIDPETIRQNLIAQLTAPVKWTQSIQQMIADGCQEFIEVGPGKTLQGLIKRINKSASVSGKEDL